MSVQLDSTNSQPGLRLARSAINVEMLVLSVRSAAERRRCMSTMLAEYGIEWSYFDAHTALACKELRYDEPRARRHYGRALTAQQVAVFSSHYAMWMAFLNRGESDYLFVLEDDVILDIDFPIRQFSEFCAGLGLDYVRLFGKHFAPANRLGFFFDRSIVRFNTTPTGMQAYLLSQAGARRLAERCQLVDAAIDLVMDSFWRTGLPIYSIFPYPVIERFAPTSIPIPATMGRLSRTERWMWNLHRSVNKLAKLRADARLGSSDAEMRRRMPAFHQVMSV
ncbi:glycosyltransferase family 25 protein [Sinorhizobium meliloti]|uniref:glycosyltransferase family 25 protein n=1 Tax=Rhizobium meliloti TaxID=382 RepID=UPI0020917D2C|nr:glycosyltransferase family 25 protein [Sinorhizobium meliloti]MCO5964840.1 glycosyltransferase family 25 protein [Sinorhizobium meliloti]